MDIQFILDAYACCSYITNYINKSNRGVLQLLREAMTEISHGSVSVKRKLQHLGSKLINATEISAQEAAYNILGLHMSCGICCLVQILQAKCTVRTVKRRI